MRKETAYIYAAAIVLILGPILSGIGNADGNAFSVGSAAYQAIVGLILGIPVVLYVLYRRKEYKNVKHGLLFGSLIWLCSLLLVGGPVVMSVYQIKSNSKLFDPSYLTAKIEAPCSQTFDDPFKLFCNDDYHQMNQELNSDLPKMIDDITRFDRIEMNAQGFKYYYTVMKKQSKVFEDPLRIFNDKYIKNICNNLEIRDSNLTFSYFYNDVDGNKLLQARVDSSLCGSDEVVSYELTE